MRRRLTTASHGCRFFMFLCVACVCVIRAIRASSSERFELSESQSVRDIVILLPLPYLTLPSLSIRFCCSSPPVKVRTFVVHASSHRRD